MASKKIEFVIYSFRTGKYNLQELSVMYNLSESYISTLIREDSEERLKLKEIEREAHIVVDYEDEMNILIPRKLSRFEMVRIQKRFKELDNAKV